MNFNVFDSSDATCLSLITTRLHFLIDAIWEVDKCNIVFKIAVQTEQWLAHYFFQE